MRTNISFEKSKEEKFNEDFLRIAFPDWMRNSKESDNFRKYVFDKHAILENLFDLLIASYFFETISSEKSQFFKENILVNIDFAKKIKIAEDLELIEEKIVKMSFKVNDYRVAQAHIKKTNSLRDPTKENIENFQKISTEAHAELSQRVMIFDKNLREKITEIINQK